jgi:assimilatory nitrate reductase catalytic subunit
LDHGHQSSGESPPVAHAELKHTPIAVERMAIRWYGTILARRAVMVPDIAYWTKIRGAGFHAYALAGEKSLAAAQHTLSAALRTTNPGPWLQGSAGVSTVISDGHVEAILALGEQSDDGARDRLPVFMRPTRLSVERAISCGAVTLDQVGAVTKAGINCGSCRSDIRALLRAGRQRKAA